MTSEEYKNCKIGVEREDDTVYWSINFGFSRKPEKGVIHQTSATEQEILNWLKHWINIELSCDPLDDDPLKLISNKRGIVHIDRSLAASCIKDAQYDIGVIFAQAFITNVICDTINNRYTYHMYHPDFDEVSENEPTPEYNVALHRSINENVRLLHVKFTRCT